MFHNASLKFKLMMAFSGVVLCFLIVGGVSYNGLQKVTQTYDHVVEINFRNTVNLTRVRAAQKDLIIATNLLLGTHASAADVAKSQGMVEAAIKTFEASAQAYESVPWGEGEEAMWQEAKKKWAPFQELTQKLIHLSVSGTKEDEAARDRLGSQEYVASQKELLDQLNRLIDYQSKESEKWTRMADDSSRFTKHLTLALILGASALALLMAFFFSTSLTRHLNDVASRMLESARTVASSSTGVSAAGAQLSSSIAEQSAAVQETVSSVEEISAMVQKNTDNAKRSKEVAEVGQQTVLKGKQVVESMISSIDDINRSNGEIVRQIEENNRQIAEIVKLISEIGNKTKVINDIVFQTKLLSFNASVEAARAGEHGKGFAVVAEEVGNLAQMSGNAAKEISQMLDASVRKADGILNETQSNVERLVQAGRQTVERGLDSAKQCGNVLDKIVQDVSELSGATAEIATASQEQAQGVHEVNKAMTQMDQVAHQNAAASQNVASAAEQLSSESQNLRNLVESLKILVQGKSQGDSLYHDHDHDYDHANAHPHGGHARLSPSNNVVDLPRRREPATIKPLASKSRFGFKKAVGTGDDVPADSDPRFKDV